MKAKVKIPRWYLQGHPIRDKILQLTEELRTTKVAHKVYQDMFEYLFHPNHEHLLGHMLTKYPPPGWKLNFGCWINTRLGSDKYYYESWDYGKAQPGSKSNCVEFRPSITCEIDNTHYAIPLRNFPDKIEAAEDFLQQNDWKGPTSIQKIHQYQQFYHQITEGSEIWMPLEEYT